MSGCVYLWVCTVRYLFACMISIWVDVPLGAYRYVCTATHVPLCTCFAPVCLHHRCLLVGVWVGCTSWCLPLGMLFVSTVDTRRACTYRHVCYLYGRCLGGCTSGRVPIGMLFVWSMSGWVYFRTCTYRHVCYLYGRCLGGCTSGRVPIGMLFVWSMSGGCTSGVYL